MADDLERRVILEIERKAERRRENDLSIGQNRSSTRRRSFKREKDSSARHFSASSNQSQNGQSCQSRGNESSGYSSINLTDSNTSNTDLPPKESKFRNFANLVKTNPVARKLKILAPGDSYSDLDSRLRIAKWYHQGLPK